MSQAYRRTGSRDEGQRYPRERSLPVQHRQNKPYNTGVPPRDPTQTASILKTRAFKMLVDAVGTDNIALALDSNLARVKELENGERFTPETAFHMETTLGLPDGFFDQPDPVLAPEIVARLKSPLELWAANADIAHTPDEVDSVVAVDRTVARGNPEDALLVELEMPENKRSGSTRKAAGEAPAQSPASREPRALAEIRRINLHTLTTHKGAKSQLGRLLEIGQSNMAHRLHGQKRMDDLEAQRVTDKLGLPSGWLDIPRELADVPEAVVNLLSPSSRSLSARAPDKVNPGRKSGSRASPKEASAMKAVPGKRAAPAAADSNALSAVTLPQRNAELALEQPPNGDPLIKSAAHDEVSASAVSDLPDIYPSMSATSLETLRGIAPIAEALIKTLAGKARTGHMDEAKALQLLQQIVLL